MKKEKKPWSKTKKIVVPSIIVGIIAAFALGVGFGFGYTDPRLTRPIQHSEYYENWMSTIDENAPISKIALPGSHDAGTNGMMPQARCQGHDIKDQLKAGVRYFDLRVTYNSKKELAIYHGPVTGQKLDKVLNEFNDFITTHPKEFLILDFQHFDKEADLEAAIMLDEILPSTRLYNPVGNSVETISLKKLRDNYYKYAVVWHVNDYLNTDVITKYKFLDRKDYLQSDYIAEVHKSSDGDLLFQMDTYFINAKSDRFFVLQSQKTCKSYLGKPGEYEKKFDPAVSEYIRNIKDDKDKLAKTNIIMRDFIASDVHKTKDIINLNYYKGYMPELIK